MIKGDFHIIFFKEELIPLFKNRYSVLEESFGIYKISGKKKFVSYDLYAAKLQYKPNKKPVDQGVDNLLGKLIRYLG